MSRFIKICVCAVALSLALNAPAFALAGLGVQYGLFDFSLNMKDKTGEQLVFENLQLNLSSFSGTNPGYPDAQISGRDIPIKIDRLKWQRSLLNFGGKVYIDIIPFIDCVELSGHFGLWEYQGKMIYPTSMAFNGTPYQQGRPFSDYVDVQYDTTVLTLKELGLGNFMVLSNTPYAKLNVDLSVRKYLVQFPKATKTLRLYAGAGVDVNFATPMLSANLIKDALGTKLDIPYDINQFDSDLFGDTDVMKEVCNEIIAQMFTPHYGCHIIAGVMVKIPIIPIGVYVDGKFVIPFDKMDKYVNIGGLGVLVNAGISLSF